jgi:hypothetical protein
VTAAVNAAAASVASGTAARAHDGAVTVHVEPYQARLSAAAGVVMDHPGGSAIESKYGYLKRAAIAAGLDVKAGKRGKK